MHEPPVSWFYNTIPPHSHIDSTPNHHNEQRLPLVFPLLSTQVLDLSVRAWHAIIAVTPPVATPRPHLTMEVEEVELEPTACKSFAPFSEAEGCAMKADPFDDPANALVRCLCGIVTGRWKQAASALKGGSTPKKAWDLHAVEAIHFLTGMVKVRRSISIWGGRWVCWPGGVAAVEWGGVGRAMNCIV